jgi:hypothetical protein
MSLALQCFHAHVENCCYFLWHAEYITKNYKKKFKLHEQIPLSCSNSREFSSSWGFYLKDSLIAKLSHKVMTAAPKITHLECTTLSFDEIQKSALALHSNFHFRTLTFTDIHMEFTRFKRRVLGLI